MPTTYKVLGQVAPSATTWTNLYLCPSSPTTQTVISTVSVCNTTTSEAIIRMALRPNNAALATSHYLLYDISVLPNDTFTMTLGVTMDSGDYLDVYSNVASVAFNCFGSEIT